MLQSCSIRAFFYINAMKCKHNQLILFKEYCVCEFKYILLKMSYQFLILTFIRHIGVSTRPNSTSSDSVQKSLHSVSTLHQYGTPRTWFIKVYTVYSHLVGKSSASLANVTCFRYMYLSTPVFNIDHVLFNIKLNMILCQLVLQTYFF